MRIEDLPKRSEIKEQSRGYELYREAKCESEPERLMLRELLKSNYKPELQYPIGNFFVDFAFPQIKLAIEYDGIHHLQKQVEDYRRHEKIRALGWTIIRVRNTNGWFKVMVNEKEIWTYKSHLEAIAKAGEEAIWKLKVAMVPERKLPRSEEMLVKNSLGRAFERIQNACKKKIIITNIY